MRLLCITECNIPKGDLCAQLICSKKKKVKKSKRITVANEYFDETLRSQVSEKVLTRADSVGYLKILNMQLKWPEVNELVHVRTVKWKV